MTSYLNWPHTEEVRYLARRSTGTTSRTIRIALRQSVRVRDLEAAGLALSGQEIAWNIPVALLSPIEPQAGDAIVDSSGIAWAVVGSIQKLGRTSRWKLVCVKAR